MSNTWLLILALALVVILLLTQGQPATAHGQPSPTPHTGPDPNGLPYNARPTNVPVAAPQLVDPFADVPYTAAELADALHPTLSASGGQVTFFGGAGAAPASSAPAVQPGILGG